MTRGTGTTRSGAAARAAGLAVVCASLGCAPLIIQNVRLHDDGWTMTIDGLADGPDGFTTGGGMATYYTPDDGERFFRLRISLRNDGPGPREFNFDRCRLADGLLSIEPGLVATAPMSFQADRAARLGTGESVERWLIFSYPRDRSPTLLSCGLMVVNLPPIPPRVR